MYLLYLRIKVLAIRYKLIVKIIFIANSSFLLLLFIIGLRFIIKDIEPNWLFKYPMFISGCILIPTSLLFNSFKLTDLQKKILCSRLKTGYERCDQIIETIVKTVRERKIIKRFSYKGLEISGLYLNETIDEPIINPSTINESILEKLIIYKMPPPSGENWLYLREFLVAYTDSPLDYVELEKSFFHYLS